MGAFAEGAQQAGADATGNASTSASGALAVPSTGWRRLDNILQAIVGAINGNQRECVTRAFNNRTNGGQEDIQTAIDDAISSLPTMELSVCVDGEPTTITVLLPPAP